jgi:hypothetical protein
MKLERHIRRNGLLNLEKMFRISPILILAILGCMPNVLPLSQASAKPAPTSNARSFPYGGDVFNGFVDDSFKVCQTPDPDQFYKVMDKEFQANAGTSVNGWIKAKSDFLQKSQDKAAASKEIGAELHKLIKKSIRKFSLDRGFEFANVVSTGERQCFLQSVLISGILQKVGLESGVAMVWKNIEGQPSNNGHAVCLLRLDPSRLIVVDASEPMPFPTHKGLFAFDKKARTYAFLLPSYLKDASVSQFDRNDDGSKLTPSDLQFLDIPFLKSQFDYYRGERVPQGILDRSGAKVGLEASRTFFEKAEKECPNNPLVLAMLSRTYSRLGMEKESKETLSKAVPLYRSFGWIPGGLGR